MNAKNLLRSVGVFVVGLSCSFMGRSAAAQTFTWDASGAGSLMDGPGSWNTSGVNWWNGSTEVSWPNAGTETAIFGTGNGAAGTVTVGSVTTNSITFNTPGSGNYLLTGGTITLANVNPTITVNAASATINSVLAGNYGLTKAGNGTLNLTSPATYSGPTILAGGTLKLPAASGVVNSSYTGTGTPGALSSSSLIAGLTPTSVTNSSPGQQGNGGLNTGTTSVLTDGANTVGTNAAAYAGWYTIGSNGSLTYTLAANSMGYNISSVNVYGDWGDSGRSQVTLTNLSYSTVAAPTVFIPITNSFASYTGGGGNNEVTYTAAGGLMASNVYAFQFNFGSQENGYVGYGELQVVGSAANNYLPALTPLTIAPGATFDLAGNGQQLVSISDSAPGNGGSIINSNAGATSLLLLSPTGGMSSTYSGTIQGGGALGPISLAINGNGTQVLAGSNTYTGATTITAGTLNLANSNAVKNSTVTVNSPGGLAFSPGVGTFNAGALSGTGSFVLQDTSGSAVTLSAGAKNTNTAYSGALSGPGSFVKSGSGTLFLASSSSYTGPTVIAGGTLKLPAPAGTVGTTSGVGTTTLGTPIGALSLISGLSPTINTNAYAGEGGNFTTTGPVSSLTDGINLTSHNAAGESTWYSIGDNASLTYVLPASGKGFNVSNVNIFGNWDDTGRSAVYMSNISYSTISSPNVFTSISNTAISYNGGADNEVSYSAGSGVMATNVYAIQFNFAGNIPNSWSGIGELEVLGNAVAAGNNFLPVTSPVQLGASSGSAILDLSGVNQQVASLSDYGGFTNGVVTSNGGPATLTLSAMGGSTTFSGAIQNGLSSGVMSLVMSGSGIQTLAGTNTYTGATTISGGTLQLGTGLSGQDGSIASTSGISNNGALVYDLFGSRTLNSYAITGSGSLSTLGPSALVITTNNGYTGATTISAGTLQIGNGGASGSISATSKIVDNASLIFSRSDAYGGNYSQIISGTGSVFATSGGSLTLAGNSTYSGATTVNTGMLLLSNAGSNNIAASSLITLNSAGTLNVNGLASGSGITLTGSQTLRGLGKVIGSVTAPSGATILSGTGNSVGTGIGTLTITNSLSLASGANVEFYLGTPGTNGVAGSQAGLINVQGLLNLPSSGVNLILPSNGGVGGLGSAGNGTYELFSYGSLGGSFNPNTTFNTPSGKTFVFSSSANQIDVTIAILSLNWTGTGSSSWDTVGSTNWANGTTGTSYQDGINVVFGDTNPITGGTVGTSNVVIQAAGVQPNLVTFNNNAVTYTLSNASGTAGIGGNASIVVSGTGTVNLQSPNSFMGAVTINSGILNISNSAALGTSSGVSIASGGALQLPGNISIGAIPLALSGSGFAASPAGALSSSGTNSYAGPITLSGPSTIEATAGQLTLTGGINYGGNVLTIGGSGTTAITAPGTSGGGGLTVNNGATLNVSGSMSSSTNLVAYGAVNLISANQTIASLNDSGVGTGIVNVNNTALSLTGTSVYSGSITGGGSLTTLSGALSLSGTTSLPTVSVNGGTLNVTAGSVVAQTAFNAGTSTINLAGGVLRTPAWTGGTNTTVNFSGGTLQANASSTNFLGGNPLAPINVNINSGNAVIDTQTNNISINQPLAGAGGLTKVGAGVLTLTNVETYSGATVVAAGTLKFGPLPVGTVSVGSTANYSFAPAGNNLLLGATPLTNTNTLGGQAGNVNGGNGNQPTGPVSVLTDGNVSNTGVTATDLPNIYTIGSNASITYSLGSSTYGYNLSKVNVYSEWNDGGRGAITFNDISYSTVANPNVFLALPNTAFSTNTGSNSQPSEYESSVTASGGLLASGVADIRFDFGSLENGWVGFAELEAVGTPTLTNVLPATTPVTVVSGGTLDLSGQSQQVASLSGSGAVTSSAVGNVTLSLGSTASGLCTYGGTIGNGAGTVNLTLNGGASFGEYLTGVNTFTGSVSVVNAGFGFSKLYLANSGALLGPTLTSFNSIYFDQSVASHAFTIGGISGNFTLGLSDDASTPNPVALSVGAGNQNTTFSGSITDGSAVGGSLTKVGTGILTLAGGATYTGGTFINAGELGLGGPNPLPATGRITFGGGALQYTSGIYAGVGGTDYSPYIVNSTGPINIDTNGQSVYFGAPLASSNSGGLTKSGAGILTLGAGNAYGGTTTIAGGELSLANTAAIPSGSTITFTGGALQYTASNTVDYSSQIANSTGPIAIDTNGLNVTIAGVLASTNSGGLTKQGLGTLVLNASNAYTGTTTVSAGVLQLGVQAGIPVNSTLNLAGGTLDVNGFSKVFSQSSSFLAAGTLTNSGSAASVITLSATNNAMTISSLIQDGVSPVGISVSSPGGTAGQELSFTNSGNTFSGGVLINNAAARMFGTNANTALGTGTITIVNSGVLLIWANTGSFAGSETVANNFVLSSIGGTQGAATSIGGVEGTKSAIFTDGATAGSPLTILTGTISLASNGGIGGYPGDSLTVQGLITGTGALYKDLPGSPNGGNVTILSNSNNNYQGGTVISKGTLGITADGVLGSGSVTFGANSTLQAEANNIVLNAGRAIVISTPTGTIDTQNYDTTILGSISGTGALTTTGGTGGVLTLSGSNSYGGGTYINVGVLSVANTAAISLSSTSSNISFHGGTLQYTASNTIDYSSNITFSGAPIAIDTNGQDVTFASPLSITNVQGLTKIGSGTLTLNADNNYTGTTSINGGKLILNSGAALPAGQPVTFGGGTLQYTANNFVDYSGVIQNSTSAIAIDTNGQSVTFASPLPSSNTGGLTKYGSGTLTLAAINAYTGVTKVRGGTLQLGDGLSNVGSVAGNIALANNSALVFATPAYQSQVYSGVISGSGSVTMNGQGALQLTGNHTYSGPTAINSGTVQLGGPLVSGFGADISTVTPANGYFTTYNYTNSTWTVNSYYYQPTGFNVGPISNNVLTLTDGAGGEDRTAFYNTPVPVNSSFTAAFTYTPSPGTGTADGMAFVLQNDSRGAQALGGAGGALGVGTGSYGGGAITPSAEIEFNLYNNVSQTGYDTNGTASTPINAVDSSFFHSGDPLNVTVSYNASADVLTWSMTDAYNSSLTFSTSQSGVNLSSVVGSSTALVGFTGATGAAGSTQTISNFNFSAVTASTNILPATTGLSIAYNGMLDLNGVNQTVGSLTGAGNVTNSYASLATLTVGTDGTSQTFSGSIMDGNGQVAIAKVGSGSWLLSGFNSYTGGTYIGGGTLQLGSPYSISYGAVTANSGVLDLNSFSPTVASLSGSAGIITNNNFGTVATFQVNVPTATTFSGSIVDGLGQTGLTVNDGNLTLAGTNTYSGPTTLSAGALIASVNNALSPNSPLTMSGGSLLVVAGSQSIAAVVTLSETSTVLSITGGGSLDISGNILDNSGGSSALIVSSSDGTGLLSLDGMNTFAGGLNVASGEVILNGAGSLLAGSSLTIGSAPGSGGGIILPAGEVSHAAPANLSPVPEPGTLVLLAAGAMAMAFGAWRRKISLCQRVASLRPTEN